MPILPLVCCQSAFFNVELSAKFTNRNKRESVQTASVIPALPCFDDPALVQKLFSGVIPGFLAFPAAYPHLRPYHIHVAVVVPVALGGKVQK